MNIAIFRKAKFGRKSTFNHIVNSQALENQDKNLNKNFLAENKLIVFNQEKNDFETIEFVRNGNNEDLVKKLHKIADNIDKSARNDYKTHKNAEKDKIFAECKKTGEKPPKIRTVLQSKDLVKEVIIAVGGDKVIDSKEDFEKKSIEFAKQFLAKKQLENKNLISIAIHYDETTPHIHIHYNDYSFSQHTTANSLESTDCKGLTKEQKTKAVQEVRQEFAKFQDLASEVFEMSRGQKNSKLQNKSKAKYLKEQADQQKIELEKLKAENVRLNNELQENRKKGIKINEDLDFFVNYVNQKQEHLKKTTKEMKQEIDNLEFEKTKLVQEIQQLTSKKNEIKDSVILNEQGKIRINIAHLGFNNAIKKTANHYGIDSNEFLNVFDKNYAANNMLKQLLKKAEEQSMDLKVISKTQSKNDMGIEM